MGVRRENDNFLSYSHIFISQTGMKYNIELYLPHVERRESLTSVVELISMFRWGVLWLSR